MLLCHCVLCVDRFVFLYSCFLTLEAKRLNTFVLIRKTFRAVFLCFASSSVFFSSIFHFFFFLFCRFHAVHIYRSKRNLTQDCNAVFNCPQSGPPHLKNSLWMQHTATHYYVYRRVATSSAWSNYYGSKGGSQVSQVLHTSTRVRCSNLV